MGSCFNSISFPGDIVPAELRKKFDSHCNDEEYEHGHSPYNGTLSTTSGLQIDNKTFDTKEEAENYVADHTQKRGPSLAVRYKVIEKVTTKAPTFRGKPRQDWMPTKTVASVYGNGRCELVPADQLSKDEQDKVTELYRNLESLKNLQNSLNGQLRSLTNRLHRVEEDFKEEDYKELKRVRRELKKTTADLESAKKKFDTLDERLGKKIWKTETLDKGTAWLVGGWAAE